MSHAQAHATAAHHEEHFGAHGSKDHGHTIVNIWTLRFVLGALLFFTLATSGAAVAEEWIAETFHVIIPQAINVGVALSIAVVKTVLVVMFFMQLKYDNPLNTMIFLFTIITVAFFLGFTTLDVGNRRTIDTFKGRYIYEGGNLTMGGAPGSLNDRLKAVTAADGVHSIVDLAKFDKAHGTGPFAHAAEHGGHGGHGGHGAGHHDDHDIITNAGFRRELPEIGSSSAQSRPVKGVTLPGFAPAADAHDQHDAHGDKPVEKKADDHAPPTVPATPTAPAAEPAKH